MSDYPPGFYAVTSWRGKNQWAFRTRRGDDIRWCVFDAEVGDTRGLRDPEAADVRPLVVLDPQDLDGYGASHIGGLAGFLREYLPERTGDYDKAGAILLGVIRQIEAQTRPPKPLEPTGLGAVVKDRNGDRWVRCRKQSRGLFGVVWENERSCQHSHWGGLDAVEVLSEGVS